MFHTRFSTHVRPVSLAAIILVASLTGCATTPPDTTDALNSLDAIHTRLADATEEQSGLSRDLAVSLTDIAAERARLAILLDVDELLTPDGEADRSAIERLLRQGSDNAVVSEIRLGRMTLDDAVQLVGDAARAGHLSPSLRSAAEQQIVSRFTGWQRIAATREAILTRLDQRRSASAQLLAEADQLTDTIRQTSSARRARTLHITAAARGAAGLIPNPDLRDSIASLLDALLTQPAQPTTSRSQDQ